MPWKTQTPPAGRGEALVRLLCLRPRAFTLIELLIVVAIIAILAAIAVPNFMEAQVRSKVSRVQNDMRTTALGLEAYCVDNGRYPPMADKDGYVGWTERLKPLTSPVAYVPGYSVFQDIFNNDYTSRWNQTAYLNLGLVFAYREKRSLLESPGAGLVDRIWHDPDSILFGCTWQLISYGPDREMDSNNDWDINSLYDATNGTKSHGDINRFGP